jgi:hypothetical protein
MFQGTRQKKAKKSVNLEWREFNFFQVMDEHRLTADFLEGLTAGFKFIHIHQNK